MQDVQLGHVERALAAHDPSSSRFRARALRASVAVVLSEQSDGLCVLLVRRAERRGDPWSGHLAFPGGLAATGEGSLDTAVREAHEETGLELGRARRIGRLSDRLTLAHGGRRLLVVTPWVFALDRVAELRLGPELDSAHFTGLAQICRGRAQVGALRRLLGHVHPAAGHALAGARLWGLTLRMIDELCAVARGADPADRAETAPARQ